MWSADWPLAVHLTELSNKLTNTHGDIKHCATHFENILDHGHRFSPSIQQSIQEQYLNLVRNLAQQRNQARPLANCQPCRLTDYMSVHASIIARISALGKYRNSCCGSFLLTRPWSFVRSIGEVEPYIRLFALHLWPTISRWVQGRSGVIHWCADWADIPTKYRIVRSYFSSTNPKIIESRTFDRTRMQK